MNSVCIATHTALVEIYMYNRIALLIEGIITIIGKSISRGAEWCKFQLRSTFQ